MPSPTKNNPPLPQMPMGLVATEAGSVEKLIRTASNAISVSWMSGSTSVSSLKPATLAICIQSMCLLVLVLICRVVQPWWFAYIDLHLNVFSLVLIQALMAASLSQLLGMARWWRWIHAIFPLAVWGMSSVSLPHESYLLGFVASLSLYWSTFRTQVPFFPSRPMVWQHVADLIPTDKPIRMIDIGSGLGDLVMHVAKKHEESNLRVNNHQAANNYQAASQFTGIEIAPLPWLLSYVRGWMVGSQAKFRIGNYHALDFAQYDIIFAYLSPVAMLALWQKAQREMRPGSKLISYEFEIPGAVPTHTVATSQGGPMMYVWDIV